ncbi:MAG TPA: proprotein convertase P-domain-containing protein, partial [Candidatus Binatia bacterium]|nr:proprotein convertase P-domain-containing protein [Candidatus Binatia bacterium]
NEVDDSLTATGTITGFTMNIRPHKKLTEGLVVVTVPAQSWFYDYVDVPVGYTNITVVATNLPPTSKPLPIQLYLNYKVLPDFTNYLVRADLTNCIVGTYPTGNDPGATISYGPPLEPGRYSVGLYNPDSVSHDVLIGATLAFDANAISKVNFDSTGPVPVVDDAVVYNSILVTNPDTIQGINVGLRVDHERISDLSFTLISPNGTRYLLMENRGGQSTNGCGATVVVTNTFSGSATGGPTGATNTYNLQPATGNVSVTWNFYQVPDQMDIYSGTTVDSNSLITTIGPASGQGSTSITIPSSGFITVVMDATNHPPGTLWTYTIGGVHTNYEYLTFTEDTNLTTTPIKYAVPPLVPPAASLIWSDDFDGYTNQTYPVGSTFGGWSVLANQVSVVTNPPAYSPLNSLALEDGVLYYPLPTVKGQSYLLSYQVGTSTSETNTGSTNASWQLTSRNFTATQGGSQLLLDGSGGNLAVNSVVTNEFGTNVLFDNFSLMELPGNIYYQPEQSLDPLIGTSAQGTWQLEVLDNRAGATNNASLVSWQLQFTFANTNIVPPPPVITQPATNVTFTNATLT